MKSLSWSKSSYGLKPWLTHTFRQLCVGDDICSDVIVSYCSVVYVDITKYINVQIAATMIILPYPECNCPFKSYLLLMN